jgi:hypothetical protein
MLVSVGRQDEGGRRCTCGAAKGQGRLNGSSAIAEDKLRPPAAPAAAGGAPGGSGPAAAATYGTFRCQKMGFRAVKGT